MTSEKSKIIEQHLSYDEVAVYDVVGIGFGPSNIALAIAAEEMNKNLKICFLESKPQFNWHSGMLFKNATMQVSFLKDLVSFRNPLSKFTFINYLHSKNRLSAFSNRKDFFPSRIEFHDYLKWCAESFKDSVKYGSKVINIEEVQCASSTKSILKISYLKNGEEKLIFTRSIVHSTGLETNLPCGVRESDRVFHVHNIIHKLKNVDRNIEAHFIVVGGGQSAAEAADYILDEFPNSHLTALVSRYGYTPADDSPFVNEIFDHQLVDNFYQASPETRKHILKLHSSTNYTAVDLDLITTLYRTWYENQVVDSNRFTVKRLYKLNHVKVNDNHIDLECFDLLKEQKSNCTADYLICATGFKPSSISKLLDESFAKRIQLDEDQEYILDRNYRLNFGSLPGPLVYSISMSENSHGLTATLISNMAVRAGEIISDINHNLNS